MSGFRGADQPRRKCLTWQFHARQLSYHEEPIIDNKLPNLARASLVLLVILVLVKIATIFIGWQVDLKLTYIALISAMPVILLSRKRFGIIRRIDWHESAVLPRN